VQDDLESVTLKYDAILEFYALGLGMKASALIQLLSFSLTGKFSFFGGTLVQRRENRELTAKVG